MFKGVDKSQNIGGCALKRRRHSGHEFWKAGNFFESRVSVQMSKNTLLSYVHRVWQVLNYTSVCGKYYDYLSEQIQLLLPISHCLFLPPNIDAMLLRQLIFLGSASILHILLYRPLFFGNVLDLILFGSNKDYCSCSPCHHFHMYDNCHNFKGSFDYIYRFKKITTF
jgi:hypothetical protein